MLMISNRLFMVCIVALSRVNRAPASDNLSMVGCKLTGCVVSM